MLYNNYQKKMERKFYFRRLIFKNRLLIYIILGILSSLVIAFYSSKGTVYDLEFTDELVYGESFNVSAKGLFSSVTYSYKKDGSSEWTLDKPTEVGSYSVKIESHKMFQASVTKIVDFEIKKKDANLKLKNNQIVFGDIPNLVLENAYNDKISYLEFSYEDITLKETNINLENIIITDINNNDVTNNYNLDFEPVAISFINRNITVKLDHYEQTYDGNVHSSNSFTLTSGTLPKNHLLKVESSGEIVNVGTINNEITSYNVFIDDLDVTHHYNIKTVSSTLKLLKKEININSNSEEKVYDSTSLKNYEYEIIGDLVNDHELNINFLNEILEVGIINNNFEYHILDNEGNDVTSNYLVKTKYGTLKILKRDLTIESLSNSFTYDNEYHSFNEYIVSDDLLDHHIVSLQFLNELKDVSKINNEFEFLITEDLKDVTNNYNVSSIFGILEILSKEILVKSLSSEFIYNGAYNYFHEYELEGQLASDNFIDVNFKNNILEVGITENEIEVYIYDMDGNNINNNYNIILEFGNLEIVPLSVDVLIKDIDDITYYGGNELEYIYEERFIDDEFIKIKLIFENRNVGIKENTLYNISVYNNNEIDVTSNYLINVIEGVYEILPKDLTVTSLSSSKVYDDTYLENNEYYLSVPLYDFEVIEYNTINNLLNVGIIDNDFTVVIKDEFELDITENYNITKNIGKLEITKREVTFNSFSKSKIYDGNNIFNFSYKEEHLENMEYSVSNLLLNHEVSLEVFVNDKHYGDKYLIDYEFYVVNNELEDITNNYDVSYYYILLHIEQRELIISTDSSEKVYDGTYLVNKNYSLLTSLVEGDTQDLFNFTEIINVSKVLNDFELEIYDEELNLVTHNYLLTKELGTLEITKREINVLFDNYSKTYDGNTSIYPNVLNVENILLKDEFSYLINVEDKHVGEKFVVEETALYFVYEAGINMTENYEISVVHGTYNITKRDINLISNSNSKVYDDTPLFERSLNNIYLDDILAEEYIVASNFSEITNVGEIPNNFEYDIFDENHNSVLHNYNPLVLLGTLEVTKKELIVSVDGLEKVYDDNNLFENVGSDLNITYLYLVDGHYATLSFKTNSEKANNYSNLDVEVIDFNVFKGAETLTSNYDYSFEFLLVTILKREINIKVIDNEFTYEDLEFTSNDYTVSNLVNGHLISEIEFTGKITNAGVEDNDVLTESIVILRNSNLGDVTENYLFNIEKGIIKVNKRELHIDVLDNTKVYDGLPLTSDLYTSNNLVDRIDNTHLITNIEFLGSVTNIDDLPNTNHLITNSVVIINGSSNDVTSNYIINYDEGILTVTKKPITITFDNKDKLYDGNNIIVTSYNITPALVLDHELEHIIYLDNANVGNNKNILSEQINIVNLEDDFTRNYDITIVHGIYDINYVELEIKSLDANKEYDGLVLKREEFELIGILNNIFDLEVYNYSSIINVSEVDNKFDFIIKLEGTNVSNNFLVTKTYGKLEITPRTIDININEALKVYDDKEIFTNNHLSYEINNKINIHSYSLEIEIDDVNAGIYNNLNIINKTLTIKDELNQDVLSNYILNYVYYSDFIILRREVELKVIDSEFIYNDKEFSSNEYEITNKKYNLVSNHFILDNELEFTGKQTEANPNSPTINSINIASIKVFKGLVDVTSNYSFEVEDGEIIVLPRDILITILDKEKMYDGLPLTSKEFEEENLVITHNIDLETLGSIIEVNKIENELDLSSIVITRSDSSVVNNSNYNISYINGSLEVTPRDVIIVFDDYAKEYDGSNIIAPLIKDISGSGFVGNTEIQIYYVALENSFAETNKLVDHANIIINNDIIQNYDIEYINGIYEITKKDLVIETISKSKTYDGSYLSGNYDDLEVTGLINTDYIYVLTFSSILNYGETLNDITFDILNDENISVYSSYNITKIIGNLNISRHNLNNTILSSLVEEQYNGTNILRATYVIDYMNEGPYSQTYLDFNLLLNSPYVGLKEVISYELDILNSNNEDISNNYVYDINSFEFENIYIIPRPLLLTSLDDFKEYDGTPLIKHEYISDNLVLGDVITYNNPSSQTEIGESLNIFTAEINYDGVNITNNYDITYEYGSLVVGELLLIVKIFDQTRFYSGGEFKLNHFTLVKDELKDGHRLIVETKSHDINVGTHLIEVDSYKILDSNDQDVSYMYMVEFVDSYITINPKDITIRSNNITYVHDGNNIDISNYSYSKSGLNSNHTEIVTFTNTTVNKVGIYDNTFEVIILDSNGNNVTSNYNIIDIFGEITIKERDNEWND